MPAGDRSKSLPPPLFIAGPTAVGKSAVALALAERLNGEIISVDSMQVYRGLDLGTAKPSVSERGRVPHHLVDVLELEERFDAARFCSLASAAEKEIRGRGRLPIFCGGTGLYFKAYLQGLGCAPSGDAALRIELEKLSTDELLAILRERDPETLARIDPHNRRRLVRAVEVIRLTGKPFSVQRAAWDSLESGTSARIFGLSRTPADLRARIDARVNSMFRAGLLAEVKALRERGLENNPLAAQAIGYRQVLENLRGVRPLDETIELVKIRTRQFAKRQLTWFRRQLKLEWIQLSAGERVEQTAERITVFS